MKIEHAAAWTNFESGFTGDDGTRLFFRAWEPAAPARDRPPRALVFLHRGHEHSGRIPQLVPHSRVQEAHTLAAQAFAGLKVGPTHDPQVQIGPLVTRKQYERVQGYIRRGIEEGATLLAGGPGRPDGLARGYFVLPTVFGNVTNDMTIAREEIFGPVLSIIGYRDDDEAIAIANDTPYGLQAYVFGTDPARAQRVAAGITAGRVFVNGLYEAPEAPFGGFKQSGLGREFGIFGFEAYLEPKAIMGHDASL